MVNKVSKLMENLSVSIIMNVVINDIGMVIVGINVVFILFRNK